jgi:hypothetical protein
VTSWARWRVALPLTGLSSIFLVAAVYGGVTWWSDSSLAEQALTIVICLLLAVSLLGSVSIGLLKTDGRDLPWMRIGVVVLALLLSCGVTVLRRSLM